MGGPAGAEPWKAAIHASASLQLQDKVCRLAPGVGELPSFMVD